ncbi:MAG: alternative ribosome rescue aminoacyl-tRNA hydrolase ArfB [Longimicrobiales bacterium]
MDEDAFVRIDETLAIPRAELTYRATRAGGPGGQHVNTSSTRVELSWDIAASTAPDEAQRARIRKKLAKRIGQDGVLRLTDAGTRSQHRNRVRVTERFQALVARALEVPKPRKRTRPPRAAKEARLREKKKRAETKKLREDPEPE